MKRLIIAAALLLPSPAHAGFINGNAALQECAADRTATIAYCVGYVSGLYDALSSIKGMSGTHFCVPDNITAGQMRDVFIRQLKEAPEMRTYNAALYMIEALKRSWPCHGTN